MFIATAFKLLQQFKAEQNSLSCSSHNLRLFGSLVGAFARETGTQAKSISVFGACERPVAFDGFSGSVARCSSSSTASASRHLSRQ